MLDRRDIKTKARAHLRRHYVLLCVLCAVSIFLGTEFADVTGNAQSWYDILTGQETELDLEGFFEEPEEAAEEAEGRLFENYSKENLTARREEAAAQMRQMQAAPAEHTALGHSRGVLASLVNSVDSGHLYAMGATAISSIVRSERATGILLIGGSMLFYAAVWVFIRNMHAAILRRAFLETRIYSRMPLGHLLHFKMVGRWCRVALTLLAKEILERLWWLTIVGGVIKHYSYYLVPFIAAENPDVKPFEALTLSRRLMNGHKWECFKLNLSFVGWRILGFLTFGAADVLWSIPYGVAADAELYTRLRAKTKGDGMPGAERLDDDALFVHPDGETLRRHYADIVLKEDLTDNPIVDLTPVQRFFAVNFGIWLGSSIDKRIYSRQAGLRHQARVGRMELDGLAYPQRVNRLWRREAAALTGKVSYLMPATVWSLFLVFMLFSMVGWIWEVSLHMITHGTFVNRGILHGPWLPIYGGGVVLIAVLLFRLREKPALEAAHAFPGVFRPDGAGQRHALVGLLRLLPEPERADLLRRAGGIRSGRHDRRLPAGAAAGPHDGADQHEGADPGVRGARVLLLRRSRVFAQGAQHGRGHHGIGARAGCAGGGGAGRLPGADGARKRITVEP